MSTFGDPEKTEDELINEISSFAVNQRHAPGLPLAPFAALLVRLSREASATAEKNLTIQRRLIWLTITILCISIAQLGIGFVQALSGHTNKPQGVISAIQAPRTDRKREEIQAINQQPREPHIAPPATK